jgi:trehalose synthase
MSQVEEVVITPQSITRFGTLLDAEHMRKADEVARATARRLEGRAWWNINSTAAGGGVAEMLPSLLAYARGAGIDARWLVITGTPDFFHLTKRLHHALHGMPGDGSPLGDDERAVYDAVMAANAEAILDLVRPRDIVLLHDPQTAGLAPILIRHGAAVIWRCHVGADVPNAQTALAWEFLEPYLQDVAATIFSRQAYVPECCHPARSVVIAPSIDAFAPKNQELDEPTVRAILVHTGLIEGPSGEGQPLFQRLDGSSARVERQADVVRHGPAPAWDTPLIVQVSRWDPLKDPIGVIDAFAHLVRQGDGHGAELVLAGPNVAAVSDDPEGQATFNAVVTAWHGLPDAIRGRIHLASLPMMDSGENAAIVNALQRHAAVVVQKSLREGFGLTVTEAMWKARPVVASRVGGIQDQIVDGVHGLLIDDATDSGAFAEALGKVLNDHFLATRLGTAARQRVQEEYLGVQHLLRYAELLERLEN